jgi:lipoprotein NlpD
LVRSVRLPLAWLLSIFLVACSSTPERPATYTVKPGDTLYAIAWRHRLDYRDVARWNGIGSDFVIHPGEVLRLYPSKYATSRPAPAPASPAPKAPPITEAPVHWQWPVSGGTATLTTRPNGGQGLTITGQRGDEIRAAGPGRVVYTGSGLLGYGKLVIIKHNETYLSAYGHTETVTIREGDTVVAGQAIATMGAGPQGTPMLYFEIRVRGAPGNPLTLLPQR